MSHLNRGLVLAIALVGTIASRGFADTVAGVTITPDDRHILVSKDIVNGGNTERWAISFSLDDADNFQVTGNVFRSNGGEPAFVYCTVTHVDGNQNDIANATFHFKCQGNTSCHDPNNCPDWAVIADDVTLQGTFFLPH